MQRDEMKGQSAIEYLTTYGWMLIVVAVAGGTIFTTIQDSSKVKSNSDIETSHIQIEDFGITADGKLQIQIRGTASEPVSIKNLEITDPENSSLTAENSTDFSISIGGTETVSLANTERSDSTNTYDIKILYGLETLTDLQASGTIQGPIRIAENVVEKLLTSGGEISEIDIQASLRSGDGTPVCIGESCSSTSGSALTGTEKYVNRSGDNMTGTLQTDKIDFNCLGNNCTVSTGNLDGYVNTVNNSMDGTLNTTELKPINTPVCLGENC